MQNLGNILHFNLFFYRKMATQDLALPIIIIDYFMYV